MNISVEHDGQVTTVTLNRPEKLNSLNRQLLVSIGTAFEEIRDREQTRCVLLTGAGKAFAAGADIAELATIGSDQATEISLLGKKAFNAIEQFRCPVIAAVNGFALGGGCELALACDFIIASDRAKFGLPEVNLGVVPGFGGMQRLAVRVGAAMAKELIYTGKIVEAEEAARVGLANRIFSGDDLLGECKKMAAQISSVGPGAVASAKRSLADYTGCLVGSDDVKDSEEFGRLFGVAEQQEGMRAFMEKRKPNF
jgi:enoyl-CoA hydratase